MMDLQAKVDQLENRILHLEKMLGVAPTSSTKTPASAVSETRSVMAPEKSVIPGGMSWLGLAGIAFVVMAALYLVKLAVDSGWLTPFRQVVLATAFGFSLIVAAFKIKTQDREYLSYLPAAGCIILFLTALGGCLVHKLYDPLVSLLFCGLISIGCILIYERLLLFPYLLLSNIGAYLIPFFFSGSIQGELIQNYFLVVSVAYTVIAVVLESRPINVIAAYFALFTTAVIGFSAPTEISAGAAYLGLQAIIFIGGTLYHTFSLKRPMGPEQSLAYFPLILFFYGLEYSFLDRLYPEMAPYAAVAFAMALLFVYAALKRQMPKETALPSEDILLSSATLILTHAVYFVLTPDIYQPLLFIALAGVALYFYHNAVWPKSWELFRKILKAIGFGLAAWNYAMILFSLLTKDDSIWTASGFLMSVGLLGVFKFSGVFKKQQEDIPAILYTPHVIMAASLYAILKPFGSFAVSFAWALYALAVLGYGYKNKDKTFARSSLVILILSSLKAFFYDLSGANTGARIACLLVTGILLYISGWMFRKI
jgi:uncharacterized membrane protein